MGEGVRQVCPTRGPVGVDPSLEVDCGDKCS